jgi:hypothetical protein
VLCSGPPVPTDAPTGSRSDSYSGSQSASTTKQALASCWLLFFFVQVHQKYPSFSSHSDGSAKCVSVHDLNRKTQLLILMIFKNNAAVDLIKLIAIFEIRFRIVKFRDKKAIIFKNRPGNRDESNFES